MKNFTHTRRSFKGIRLLRMVMALSLAGGPSGPLPLAAAIAPAGGEAVRPAQGPAGAPLAAAPARVKNVSFENECVRVQMDRPVSYRVFSLPAPPRIVVELNETLNTEKSFEAGVKNPFVKRIRTAQFKLSPEKVTRVVLDMTKMPVYKAVQTGNDITLRFTNEAPAGETAASGKAEAAVTAAARDSAPAKRAKEQPKDLLAALPTNSVTIDFDNANIRDVIRVLSEMSGINMIHSPDLQGIVTIHLDQVPFREAFNTILTMHGLVAQQMGNNVLRILTPESLSADRAKSVTTYKTFVLNYAKASEVQQHLAAVKISPSARSTVDVRNNALIVTDTPEGLLAAERLISELDQQSQQVLIEVKMVEVTLSDNLDLGIQWEYSGVNRNKNNTQAIGIRETKTSGDTDAGAVGFVNGPGLLNNPSTNATAAAVSSVGPGERGTGVALPGPTQAAITFGFINNTDLLTATLGALARKGTTKILSSPKVITINNQEAHIQVGQRIPYQSSVVSQTGAISQSTTFVDVGIMMSVTPTINADNRVRLRIRPEVSYPGTISSLGPEIFTRNAETEVLIRDGETLVVGGLIDDQMRQSASKVPLLGDIPVLGVFFRSSSDEKRRTELLVFVTPRILKD